MLVLVEPTLKYHPDLFEVLTLARYPGREQCMVGSLTGAVPGAVAGPKGMAVRHLKRYVSWV